jgi:hypothetical protein
MLFANLSSQTDIVLRIAMFEPPAVERDKGRYRFSEGPSVKSEKARNVWPC